jgi:hypothetical protein
LGGAVNLRNSEILLTDGARICLLCCGTLTNLSSGRTSGRDRSGIRGEQSALCQINCHRFERRRRRQNGLTRCQPPRQADTWQLPLHFPAPWRGLAVWIVSVDYGTRGAFNASASALGVMRSGAMVWPLYSKLGGGCDRLVVAGQRPSRSAVADPWRTYTSVCSVISSTSSTSMPRYLTVLSSLVWPRRSWTARRFLVRR